MAEILPVWPDAPDEATMRLAADALREGEVVALPTDTVYGLCARAEDAKAVKKLYEIKGREAGKGAPILIGRLAQLSLLTRPLHENLWEKLYLLWPGPLTLILPAGEGISPLLTEGGGGVAVRYPKQDLCQALARAAGPFAATSANAPGEPPLADTAAIEECFGKTLGLILDGGNQGEKTAPSTVVDVRGEAPRLIREGAYPFGDVVKAWEGA